MKLRNQIFFGALCAALPVLALASSAPGEIRLSPGMTVRLAPYQDVVVRCGDAPSGNSGPVCSVQRTLDVYQNVIFQIKAGDQLLDTVSKFSDALARVQQLSAAALCSLPYNPAACSVLRTTDVYQNVIYDVKIASDVVDIESTIDAATTSVKALRQAGLCQ